MKRFFIGVLVALLMQACAVMKSVEVPYIVPQYQSRLVSVELPADAKERYGETILADSTQVDTIRYVFEDDYIKISWFVGKYQFYFTLFNKSDHSLKIVWDDAALVSPDNTVSRLMHGGVKYDSRNESQVSTTIPRGAKIDDVLIPIREQFAPILPENIDFEDAQLLKGEKLKVLLPIKIEDVQNEYTFVFDIDVAQEYAYTTKMVHDTPAEVAAGISVVGTLAFFVFLLTRIMGGE